MLISLIFSVSLYRVSSEEIERNNRRNPAVVNDIIKNNSLFRIDVQELLEEQEQFIEESKRRLKGDLTLINLVIFMSGGVFSYLLARKTLEPIERAHEAQSRFTADASHELRTPITAIRAETELTLTDPKLTLKKARDQMQSTIEELDKLTELSEGLLQLARLENQTIEKEEVPLDHIVQHAVERVQSKAEDKKQIISVGKLPDTAISVNQIAMTEAIVTLLDNACKYSPEKTEIKLTAKSTRNTIQLSVKDNGPGIPSADQPFIFDRFYRADNSRSTASQTHGYGIGLSLAKSIMEAHGGSISVKSVPKKGATFTLSIPRK